MPPLAMQSANGYIASTETGEVPLLGSTEKLLKTLGYAVPVKADKMRDNRMPAADYEPEIVFEAASSDDDDDANKAKAKKKKRQMKKKTTDPEQGADPTKTTTAADVGNVWSEDDEPVIIVPEQDLKYQNLKRVQQTVNTITMALDDVKRWKHRDFTKPKKTREQYKAEAAASALTKNFTSKRDKGRQKAMEAQRARLQKQLSGASSSDEEIQEELALERERMLDMVRAINSIAMLANVLIPMLLHERRMDRTLVIGKTKLAKDGSKAQCFLLGEFVYDVMPQRSCRILAETVKRVLGLMVDMSETKLGGNEKADKASWFAWRSAVDKVMDSAVAFVSDQHPAPPDHKDFLDKFQNAAWQDVGKKLDDIFDLASVKDEDEHAKYLVSIDALQKRIDELCKQKFGEDSHVSVYGSCLSDLSLGKNADVDINLYVEKAETLKAKFEAGALAVEQYEKQMRVIAMNVFRILEREQKEFREMQPAVRARVPVVRGSWIPANNPHSEDGSINFDVCLLNDIAVANSTLIKEYSIVDPRVRQLMVLVKRWAKENGVCSAKDNSLSSYAWVNLVIFYLQSLGLVPNLQSAVLMEKAGVKRDMSNSWHCVCNLDTCFLTWEQAQSIWTQPSHLKDLSVSGLLCGFFSFYASDFLTLFYMIGIKRGGGPPVPRTKFPKGSFFFCIEDPFETYDAHIQHDLSTPVGETQQSHIIECLRAGAKHLDDAFQKAANGPIGVHSLWPPSSVETTKGPAQGGGRGGKWRRKAGAGKKSNRNIKEKNAKTPAAESKTAIKSAVAKAEATANEVGAPRSNPTNDVAAISAQTQETQDLGATEGRKKNRVEIKGRKGRGTSARPPVDNDKESVNVLGSANDTKTAALNTDTQANKEIEKDGRGESGYQGRGGRDRGRGGGRGGRGRGRGRSGGRAGRIGGIDREPGGTGDNKRRNDGGRAVGADQRRKVRGRGRKGNGDNAKASNKDSSPDAVRKRRVFDVLKELKALGKSKRNVLVRVDFNVPMTSTGAIADDSRIRGALSTIRAIIQSNVHKSNAILVSHMGRPKLVQKGEDTVEMRKEKQSLSLKPVAEHLGKLLKQEILFADDCLNAHDTIEMLSKNGGSVVLLENLRFYEQEENNDKEFAQTLAKYADAFVNDAFGTCHRAHASTAGVPALLDAKLCGIGVLVAKELKNLDFSRVSESDKIAAIIGGAKVSTKLPVIQGILKKADMLILQGGLAFTFLKAQGVSVGSSLLEDTMIDTARRLLDEAKASGKEIVLPVDVVCAQKFPSGPMEKSETQTFDLTPDAGIPYGCMGLDIGPKSVELFAKKLQGATKIVFNGPAGVFECTPFDDGTRGLIKAIAKLTTEGTLSVVGGGDSVAALNQFGETKSVSYVSTGGGATLELLAGDVLPGIAAIADYGI